MHQVTLQDDCQGQWGCEYRHVHPGSPTDSHPDQSHSSASPSPHVFHVIHLRVSTGPLASSDPNMGTLDLEGIPSRPPRLPTSLFSRVQGRCGEILRMATGQGRFYF